MLYDIAHFWIALLIAFALGFGLSWSTKSQDRRSETFVQSGGGRLRIGALLFAVGLVLALVRALPGRPGLWLETALLLSAAYVLGWLVIVLLVRTRAATELSATISASPQRKFGKEAARFGVTQTSPFPSRWALSAAAVAALSALLLLGVAFTRRRFASSGRRRRL